MLIDIRDARCRTCGSQLAITGADDCTMTVECTECADTYDLEPDAPGDGCMTYYVPFIAERLGGGDPEN